MSEKTEFFEIVKEADAARKESFNVETKEGGSLCFRPLLLNEKQKEEIKKQISRWELVDSYRSIYEDLSYGDRTKSEGERIITDELLVSFLEGSLSSDQVRGGYLLDQGRFIGYIILNESVSSFGMSVEKNRGFGVLLTDGRKYGKTSYHYFHASTEISESEDSDYSVRPKA